MNPYNIDQTEQNLQGPIISLGILYDNMPKTSGCEKCHEVNGDDAIWCCKKQNPSMFYVEFLKVWQDVQNAWSTDDKTHLILRAIKNHLINAPDKGCIFHQDECTVYENRPFACRMYGVVSEEAWNRRWETLKKQMGDAFNAKPQCDLVNIEQMKENPDPHKKVPDHQENSWYEHTKKCEERIGVDPATITSHDLPGGSYRTFHDHLLLELFDEGFLHTISQVRLTNPSQEDIDKTVEAVRDVLEERTS